MATCKKEAALLFLTQSKKRNPEASQWVHPDKYRCHHKTTNKGLLGFAEKMLRQQNRLQDIQPLQIIQDGNIISAISSYNGLTPRMDIDILRFYGDKIIEHWENQIEIGQSGYILESLKSTKKVPIRSRGITKINKQLAIDFMQEVCFLKNTKSIKQVINTEVFLYCNSKYDSCHLTVNQHQKIIQLMKGRTYNRIIKMIGEGNQVIAYSEGSKQHTPCILIDLIRFENNKITELKQMCAENT